LKFYLTILLAAATSICTLMAAWEWFVAARIKPSDKWDAKRPKGLGHSSHEHWVHEHNVRASIWAVAAALFSAATSVWTALSHL
jgi:hypothetical protein